VLDAVPVGEGAVVFARQANPADGGPTKHLNQGDLLSSARIQRRIVGALAGAALAGSALLGAGAGTAHAVAATKPVKVSLRKTSHGKVLVAPNGHSLYNFSLDTKKTSHCNATCRVYWKPLMSKARPVGGAGVKAGLLGRTTKHQVTYNGRPLYTYVVDSKAGQTHGEDTFASGGYWYLMNANGHSVF